MAIGWQPGSSYPGTYGHCALEGRHCAAACADPSPAPMCLSSCAGGARLVGKTTKRVADGADAGLDAFLGPAGTSRGTAGRATAPPRSVDDIEQMLFQAAPQDFSDALKPKKKQKQKQGSRQ